MYAKHVAYEMELNVLTKGGQKNVFASPNPMFLDTFFALFMLDNPPCVAGYITGKVLLHCINDSDTKAHFSLDLVRKLLVMVTSLK